MQISVTGKQVSVGASLTEHVKLQVEERVLKYFERAVEAHVVFTKEAHLFVASINVNDGTGHAIITKGSGKAVDAYAAFESAAERMEKQLRRYKRRLKNHHSRLRTADAAVMATKYVFSAEGNENLEEEDSPLIIAEKQMTIETLTVSDAVMRMNLAHVPALLFINKKTGGVNVVYYREDGNISWVDSNIVTDLGAIDKALESARAA